MAFGVTEDGFVRKTRADILASIASKQRDLISKFLLTDSENTVIGNLNSPVVDELAIAWEAIEGAYHGFDPDNATGFLLKALAALTGVDAEGATKGLVTATVNLDASQDFEAGELVAHVDGDTSNRWVNRDAVSSTSAGDYQVVFESETAGSDAIAPAGTLTVIAQGTAGWNSITNASDATPGQDEEEIEELRQRREASLSPSGESTLPGLKTQVLAVEGVESVLVLENTEDVTANGLPPHSMRVVVWDGNPAAADTAEIAQTIYDNRPGGANMIGSVNANITTVNGETGVLVTNFDRATQHDLSIEIDYSGDDVSFDDVKDALIAAADYDIGEDVDYDKLKCAVVVLDGVDAVNSFTIDGGTSDVVIGDTTIALLDSGNISQPA